MFADAHLYGDDAPIASDWTEGNLRNAEAHVNSGAPILFGPAALPLVGLGGTYSPETRRRGCGIRDLGKHLGDRKRGRHIVTGLDFYVRDVG